MSMLKENLAFLEECEPLVVMVDGIVKWFPNKNVVPNALKKKKVISLRMEPTGVSLYEVKGGN